MERYSALWLAEIAEGSVSAFGRFYDAYASMVYRIALQMTKDATEAEDLCQEVFLEVMDKADQYDPGRGSVEAWLAVRTRSRAVDRLRKRRRAAETEWSEELLQEVRGAEDQETVELSVLRRLEVEQVKRALHALPPLQRMAVYGCYVEQLSHREMAELMKRPLGTVKSLIRYGLRNVRRLLEQDASHIQGEGGTQHESIKART